MKLRTVKHRLAKRDALQIFVYTGEHSLDAAERFLNALNDDIAKLVDMPGVGSLREFANPKLADIRSWPITGFRNYLIFYRTTRSELQVLRILHGARDIERALQA